MCDSSVPVTLFFSAVYKQIVLQWRSMKSPFLTQYEGGDALWLWDGIPLPSFFKKKIRFYSSFANAIGSWKLHSRFYCFSASTFHLHLVSVLICLFGKVYSDTVYGSKVFHQIDEQTHRITGMCRLAVHTFLACKGHVRRVWHEWV